jgi:hypothetical protein
MHRPKTISVFFALFNSSVDWALILFYTFNCWANRYFEEVKKNAPAHQSDKYCFFFLFSKFTKRQFVCLILNIINGKELLITNYLSLYPCLIKYCPMSVYQSAHTFFLAYTRRASRFSKIFFLNFSFLIFSHKQLVFLFLFCSTVQLTGPYVYSIMSTNFGRRGCLHKVPNALKKI